MSRMKIVQYHLNNNNNKIGSALIKSLFDGVNQIFEKRWAITTPTDEWFQWSYRPVNPKSYTVITELIQNK